MTRVASIDLGTNSTRLLIADAAGGELTEVVRRSVVTRLGEGVDAEKRLLPGAVARVRAVLDEYARLISELRAERTLAVATSAVRDSSNGPEFLAGLERDYGFGTRILSGQEEAELTQRGVGAAGERTLLLDVGGGSTELIMGPFNISLDIGSVRLTERFLCSDPPTRAELDAASAHVQSLLPDLEPLGAVGVAGTVAQLHALIGALSFDAVSAELTTLAALPLAERQALPNIDPLRAPVIVAGALIVVEVLRRYGLDEIGYSTHELLDGVALLLAEE